MSATIIQLRKTEEREHHLSGGALCCQCGHKWAAMRPISTEIWLECPACHSQKGMLPWPIVPPEDSAMWTCDCLGSVFSVFVRKDDSMEIMCCSCGTYQTGWL